MRRFVSTISISLIAFVFSGLLGCSSKDQPGTVASKNVVQVQEVAVEVNGVKFWLPSHIFAKKGDTVRIHLVSKVPGAGSVHGFAIEAFKIAEVADEKGKDIEFVADKAGIFPIKCHLHPAHVGGQLVVLE